MADIPYLGCKISLISKCDIRYEGILYCVDAKESTIALSKVKSHGTENRADPNSGAWVAPKNEIYDIIIFRASDVKDLRVDTHEPPGFTDPAIISAHHSYPGQSTSSFNNLSNNNSSTSSTAAPTLNSNGSLTNSGPSIQQQHKQQQQQQQQQQQHQKPLLPFMPTSSKDQHQSHQSTQLPSINYSSAAANAQRRARPEPREKKLSEDVNNKKPAHESSRENRRDDRRSERRDDRRDDKRDDRKGPYERRDHERRRGSSNPRVTRLGGGGYDAPRHDIKRDYNDRSYPRRGPINRDKNSKGGPPFRRGPMQGGRRPRSGDRTGGPRGLRKGAPLKFDGEYDFDEANKQFLELEGKLKSLKLKGDEKDAESSGDGLNSKSPAGLSDAGSGFECDDQNNKSGDSKDDFTDVGGFYDKAKSFFDNISCEASERSQGKVNKPDWRKERQLNTETFGVSTSYHRRGGYRGRVYGANGYHRR